MIAYYNPHYGPLDLIKTIFCRKADARLREKFRKITGKNYILITSSCRSALYLAYKAIEKNGTVHTSPLTCKVALMPILAAGNKILFHDVKLNDWTMEAESLERDLCVDSVAIQAIHLGGFPCEMPALKRIADANNLVLIEDCAQGFGASFQGTATGRLGDVSCFTLTKNLFSLGGGIFATNNKEWYLAAQREQELFPRERPLKILYRVVLAILGTYRANRFCESMYQRLKRKPVHKASQAEQDVLIKELRYPSGIYAKSCISRWDKIQGLVKKRKASAKTLLMGLAVPVGMQQSNPDSDSAYTKLFIRSEKHSKDAIQDLNQSGIEAMHLEHKHKIFYQNKLLTLQNKGLSDTILSNYEMLHDSIISLSADCQSGQISRYLSR